MKKLLAQILSVCAVLSLGASAAHAAEAWGENYTKAKTQAKTENKQLLLDFTGSDWCGWCIQLHKEVFSQQEFKDYAAKNLVLMKVDFPQTKPQAANIKQQNAKLKDQYQIEGFPTIIVLNSQGKQVGQLGYMPGGPKAFIAELEKLKK